MTALDSSADGERRQGTLTVVRPASPVEAIKFETFIKITSDGAVTAYNGHVDLGTGIRTALGQIVAEELDVSFARVVVVLGHTSRVPNQGATIASETIQITAVPLRKAAKVFSMRKRVAIMPGCLGLRPRKVRSLPRSLHARPETP